MGQTLGGTVLNKGQYDDVLSRAHHPALLRPSNCSAHLISAHLISAQLISSQLILDAQLIQEHISIDGFHSHGAYQSEQPQQLLRLCRLQVDLAVRGCAGLRTTRGGWDPCLLSLSCFLQQTLLIPVLALSLSWALQTLLCCCLQQPESGPRCQGSRQQLPALTAHWLVAAAALLDQAAAGCALFWQP
jgi:hypothetical protein